MAGVGAGAHAAVAVLNERKDVFGVPQFIFGVVGSPGVLVDGDADIEFFDQFFDQVQLVDRLRRDRIKV